MTSLSSAICAAARICCRIAKQRPSRFRVAPGRTTGGRRSGGTAGGRSGQARARSERWWRRDDFSVLLAKAREIPNVLHEIGRLREVTFRQVGEGTGKPIDLDRFDDHYWHLFVWNRHANEVAGAYRLGPSDEILARFGPKGFYTSQLFQWKRTFLDRISPALELGRSFVRPEYQKTYAPLLLLWKGIGQFLIRNPQYKLLFGPVSISNGYTAASRQLMVKFLSAYRQSPELRRWCARAIRFASGLPKWLMNSSERRSGTWRSFPHRSPTWKSIAKACRCC